MIPLAVGEGWTLRLASWADDRDALLTIRFEVFVEGQNVPLDEEVDGLDAECLHVIVISDDGEPMATGRLLPDAHIGRMAVRETWRGKGLGGAVLDSLVAMAAERGDAKVVLASQTHAIPFYARHGFRVYGPVFDDAGIPHRWMDRETRAGDHP